MIEKLLLRIELIEEVRLVVQPPASRPHHCCSLIAPSFARLLGGALGPGLEAEHAAPRALGHGVDSTRVLGRADLIHGAGGYVVLRAGELV